MPAFLRDQWCRDHIHLGVHGLHDTSNRRTGQGIKVHAADNTIVKNIDGLDRLIRHLPNEVAQMIQQA